MPITMNYKYSYITSKNILEHFSYKQKHMNVSTHLNSAPVAQLASEDLPTGVAIT